MSDTLFTEPSVQVVDVQVPVAVDTAYSYRVPAGVALAAGDFVTVPLGTRAADGVVWDVHSLPAGGGANLKAVTDRRDLPAMREPLRRFVDWLARWTLAPRGMVLRMAIRAPENAEPEPIKVGVRVAGPPPARMTPARQRVLAAAADGVLRPKAALAELAGCSVGVIDGLVDEGTLETLPLPSDPVALPPDPRFVHPSLEPSQAAAADSLRAAVETGGYATMLLEGVTGAGKTEVYFEAVAQAVAQGRQALILLPEIALTTQFLDRFAARFGVRPAAWHSGVSARRRARIWAGVAAGEIKAVAGARSALFLPFARLGVIVVDEEHEAAYKQEDGVAYHARDMAVVRARIEGVPVVLASATPSIETRVNAAAGRYKHLKLAARWGGRRLPSIAAIDLARDPPARGRWIAPALVSAVEATVARCEQALLFLNRRGYAPLTLCRQCGHRFQCPNCSAWLVEHRFRRALMCHHCGHVERRPDQCPSCGGTDTLTACGPGVERLAEEVTQRFPDARTMVLSSDFPGGIERLRMELDAIAAGEVDIVIGTQLVAKGHNFPGLTLVGIVDADMGLANGDPRAAERTFQMLHQATGRAGRGERPGRGLVQTWQPNHPVIRALVSGDAERFYGEETAAREAAGRPPFGRLAAMIVSGNDRTAAESHARALARCAHALQPTPKWRVAAAGERSSGGIPSIVLLGPAEAPIALLRGRHRFRLLAKAARDADLQGFLRTLLAAAPAPRGNVRVAIDVDPQSFL